MYTNNQLPSSVLYGVDIFMLNEFSGLTKVATCKKIIFLNSQAADELAMQAVEF